MSRERIPVEDKSTIDYVIEPFIREGSAGRMALGGALGLEGAKVSEIGDALGGTKEYTAREFMADIADQTGIDPYAGGARGTKKLGMIDSLYNGAIDLIADIATSPSTYATGGFSQIAKQAVRAGKFLLIYCQRDA